MHDKEKILIFDTTLRDGEQSPGAALHGYEKVIVAHQLAKLGVDIIEAGFPISSQGDFDSVSQIAGEVKGSTICGLARSKKEDIEAAWNAVKHAAKKRIHIFLATSDIHMDKKLHKTKDEILEMAYSMVKYGKELCPDIEFSPEDAGRTNRAFLYKILEAVIDAGATTVNIPDTVGYTIPHEYGEIIKGITHNVPNIDKAIISTHCHNDLGLATANALSGILNGARQIECTVNGLGERAGNTSLEEAVMAIKTRQDIFSGLYTGINTQEIINTSRMVSEYTSMPVQPNKAIVGENAFAHESGIHQDGFLKEALTYQIITPDSIGLNKAKIPLGPRSGRHALKFRLSQLGYNLDKEELNTVYQQFILLADHIKRVEDTHLIDLVKGSLKTA